MNEGRNKNIQHITSQATKITDCQFMLLLVSLTDDHLNEDCNTCRGGVCLVRLVILELIAAVTTRRGCIVVKVNDVALYSASS